MYYLVNGEKQEVFDPNMDNPRNFLIYNHDSEYRIGISLNDTDSETLPITYVEWNEIETDTLQAAFFKTENTIQVIKTWFNGELKWDGSNGQDNFFTIVK